MPYTHSFEKFLKFVKYDISKQNATLTHTIIGDCDSGIFGGAFDIQGDKLVEFCKMYYDLVFIQNINMYFTEKQNEKEGMMYVDLDFNYAELGRHHNEMFVKELITSYTESIKKYCQLSHEDAFNIYVLERDKPYNSGSKNKDGLHIIFDVDIDRRIQQQIRDDMIASVDLSMLPLINKIGDVFDAGITSGKTNLQMLGSMKPKCLPYKLKYGFHIDIDSFDGEVMINNFVPKMSFDLFCSLSATYKGRKCLFLTNEGLNVCESQKTKIPSPPRTVVVSHGAPLKQEDIDTLSKLEKCYSEDRINKSETWFKLGWGIANSFGKSKEVEDIFINLNDRVSGRNSNDEKDKAREWFKDKCEIRTGASAIGIGSLKKWAKEDNEALYYKLFTRKHLPEHASSAKLQELFNKDYSTGRLAKYFSEEYNKKFISVDGIIYYFTGVYWKKDDIKNTILHNFIDDVIYKDIDSYISYQITTLQQLVSEEEDDAKSKKHFEAEVKKWESNSKIYNRIREHSSRKQLIDDIIAVSYTHLTLPTSDLV